MRRVVTCVVLSVGLIATACGDERSGDQPGGAASFKQGFEDAEAYPVVVSSELVVGENRVLIGVNGDDDRPIGSPDIDVSARFFDLARSTSEPVSSADFDFVYTVKPVRGLYVGHARFDRPGEWGAEVTIAGDGIDETLRTSFQVVREGATPAIGEPAPRSDTPTLDDKPLGRLTTDPHPDRRFYRLSIAEAVESGRPSVIVFATPQFCTSEVCGPTLDLVQRVVPDFARVNFVHVEVYELPADPAKLRIVPSVQEWGLPSEPWVFVTDANGEIAAKYEGTVAPAELRTALNRL